MSAADDRLRSFVNSHSSFGFGEAVWMTHGDTVELLALIDRLRVEKAETAEWVFRTSQGNLDLIAENERLRGELGVWVEDANRLAASMAAIRAAMEGVPGFWAARAEADVVLAEHAALGVSVSEEPQ